MTNYVREIYNWSTGPAYEPYMRCVEKKDGIGGGGMGEGLTGTRHFAILYVRETR